MSARSILLAQHELASRRKYATYDVIICNVVMPLCHDYAMYRPRVGGVTTCLKRISVWNATSSYTQGLKQTALLVMATKYASAHVSTNGPGDARPTALSIVKDEGLEGGLKNKVIFITGAASGIGVGVLSLGLKLLGTECACSSWMNTAFLA